jgi:hypothetical protein
MPNLIPEVTEEPEIKYKEWVDKKTGKTKRQTMWYYRLSCLPAGDRAKARSNSTRSMIAAYADKLTRTISTRIRSRLFSHLRFVLLSITPPAGKCPVLLGEKMQEEGKNR